MTNEEYAAAGEKAAVPDVPARTPEIHRLSEDIAAELCGGDVPGKAQGARMQSINLVGILGGVAKVAAIVRAVLNAAHDRGLIESKDVG
jgi:hypothetical protein